MRGQYAATAVCTGFVRAQPAKVLNHSSPAVTMRYIGLVQQDIDDSYTEFEL
jgi:hypothetical protein